MMIDSTVAGTHSDVSTRDAIVRRLLEHGPTTATELAGELGLSGAAVRRHLDALVVDGSVTTRDAPRAAGRGRGRPARQHLLTEAGRSRAGRGWDDEDHVADLAVAAIRRLAEVGGAEAVRAFARDRVVDLVGAHRGAVVAAPEHRARVAALAEALSAGGYAASSRPAQVGDGRAGAGEQLCQHHCPVARVAAEFPQFCEAEAEVFAELLDTHVQRLSTIARGDAACTTHVPVPAGREPPDHASSTAATTRSSTVVTGRQVV